MPHKKLDQILDTVRAADRLDATNIQMVEALRVVKRRLEEIEAAQYERAKLQRETNDRLQRLEALLRGDTARARERGG